MKNTIIIVVVIIAVILAGAIFGLKGCRKAAKAVDTDKVRLRTIKSTVIAFGRVEAKSDVNISAEVSEKIESLYVDEGDTVNVGDTLVVLNSDRYIAMLNRARAQVHQVEANLKRARENLRKMKELYESGAVSQDQLINAQTEVDVLEAQLESAQAALREARDNLAHTVITSPINGIITSIKAKKGEFVVVGTMNNPGSVIMTVSQHSSLLAKVDVDEADIVDLSIGQEAKIELDAFPDTFFHGRVTYISHEANISKVSMQEQRATFPVEISVENPSPKIRPGMSVTVTITTAVHESVLAVPLSAIVAYRDTLTGKEGEGVFKYENGIARKVRIKTGISDDRFAEVLEGLSAGDEIITGPFKVIRELRDGMPVRKIQLRKFKGKAIRVKFGGKAPRGGIETKKTEKEEVKPKEAKEDSVKPESAKKAESPKERSK